MSKSTTIVNNLNEDRAITITISGHEYLLFTVFHRVLIVIDMTNKKKPILLMNRTYYSKDDLFKWVDRIVNIAIDAEEDDVFLSRMDTYIHLLDNIDGNDTLKEIYGIYRIILEDYNL